MSRLKSTIKYLFFITVCFFIFGCVSKKPNILIIGDSISVGYTPYVAKFLRGKARVYHNPKNAEHTSTGIENIVSWLKKEQWEIVQFNWGLWDICYRNLGKKHPDNKDKTNGIITTNKNDYAANLDSIVSMIKKNTKAKLIFVTTTHVPEENDGRYPKDVVLYNDTAKIIMNNNGVLVNDLHEYSVNLHEKFARGKGDVHYTSEGYKKLGESVSNFLEKELTEIENAKQKK
jgi:hypothetical protein